MPIALVLATILVGGCWNHVEDHCTGCAIVNERTPRLPPLGPSTRAVVILVHGAFGFGREWEPVVAAARARRDTVLVAFAWSGPWTRRPSLAAQALVGLAQAAVDAAPAEAEVLVIAHSAGGALARFAGERLRVPAGRRVRILSIAAPAEMNVAPYRPEREVNTPLGVAVGGEQAPRGPIAPGVEFVELVTADRPARPPAEEPRLERVWLGARVGHNEAVARAALPFLH
jgi:pimeloyl-ACP methyl ester carboxylesterase